MSMAKSKTRRSLPLRRCEKIKIQIKIGPGPQGWFSCRTLVPNPLKSNSGEPIPVNSFAYSYASYPTCDARLPKFRKENHPERAKDNEDQFFTPSEIRKA
jgi:hypothetical protein